jgi:NAD(P)-dependent dehydrogenase (short-subunit alcohol dehydrogenase family)
VAGFVGDLGDARGCDALASMHPACDILVNNLGIYQEQDFFEIPDSEWFHFFEANVMSGVRLSRAYLPAMIGRGWGRVVFVSSESALNIPVDMIHCGFTKTAQLAIARGLAKRAAGTGVTVNSVLPGPTLSEGLAKTLKERQGSGQSLEKTGADFVKANRPSSIIQRAASVEEVANMIVYVCPPQASATTGVALRVDGGIVDTIA